MPARARNRIRKDKTTSYVNVFKFIHFDLATRWTHITLLFSSYVIGMYFTPAITFKVQHATRACGKQRETERGSGSSLAFAQRLTKPRSLQYSIPLQQSTSTILCSPPPLRRTGSYTLRLAARAIADSRALTSSASAWAGTGSDFVSFSLLESSLVLPARTDAAASGDALPKLTVIAVGSLAGPCVGPLFFSCTSCLMKMRNARAASCITVPKDGVGLDVSKKDEELVVDRC